jgi:hypothetical protein
MSNNLTNDESDIVLKRGLDLLSKEPEVFEELDWLTEVSLEGSALAYTLDQCRCSLKRIGRNSLKVRGKLQNLLQNLTPSLAGVFDKYGELHDVVDKIENGKGAFDHVDNIVHRALSKIEKVEHALAEFEKQPSRV